MAMISVLMMDFRLVDEASPEAGSSGVLTLENSSITV
jgi:hypothetical protein